MPHNRYPGHENDPTPRLILCEGVDYSDKEELYRIITSVIMRLGKDPRHVLLCGHDDLRDPGEVTSIYGCTFKEIERYEADGSEWTPHDYAVYSQLVDDGLPVITVYDKTLLEEAKAAEAALEYTAQPGVRLQDTRILIVDLSSYTLY